MVSDPRSSFEPGRMHADGVAGLTARHATPVCREARVSGSEPVQPTGMTRGGWPKTSMIDRWTGSSASARPP